MATFLKIATETVYKMAGLGAFEASVAYKVNCFRLFLCFEEKVRLVLGCWT